ncbi:MULTISPECIES: Cof-type HAD-IIB family hydrolase [Microbacterium]|uniref:Cof-type HAD-IIB family hydrolase n=1 Tax=Microbacterium TaxID=33882 RepID=UPI00278B235D|nr:MULTISPECIES: Cof-type HAD-IIB family hydrolase [Microbacterium]MDQ1085330.1 Cof subfamily protein (haloacid dehalogenase superfamily) [Microbacterium sp. SORGH_AS_0344]MDQ1169365.1 Cof subfamily protein (haloacid dehalogenase superfamily) [Microbacterium proteolyticum]
MTRIAFLDVDGTILEHGSVIAPSTVDAIKQARANGHLVWLCTGRAEADIHPDVVAIGFDGAISNGGAYATRDGELLLERTLPEGDVTALEAYFQSHGIHYFLQTHDAVYASPGMADTMEEFLRARHAQRADELAALGLPSDIDHRQRDLRPVAHVDRDRVAKAVFVSPSPDTVAHAAAELGEGFHVIPGSMPLPGGSNGEIGRAGVTKGSAITEVLGVLGLSATDAIGVGDSWNDVEMFEVVGTPVAMGNAEPELQSLAGRVTTAVLEDGVRNAFAELGLI